MIAEAIAELLPNGEQAMDLADLNTWFAEKFTSAAEDRKALREVLEKTGEKTDRLGERVAVLESKLEANGGLITRETCALRERSHDDRVTRLEARMRDLETKISEVRGLLWKFLTAFLVLFAGAIVGHFIFS
jgi:hypothetical protein